MEALPLFDKYLNRDEAAYYNEIFLLQGLHPVLEEAQEYFDAIIGSNTAELYYIIRLPKFEFKEADNIIFNEIKKNGVPTDYFLNTYTKEELNGVVANPDKWSKQDIAVARIIGEVKGWNISYETVQQYAANRFEQLKQVNLKWHVLLLLYILCVFAFVLSFIIGPLLYLLKHPDFNGEQQYYFSDETRTHGIILFLLSIASNFFWVMIV